MSSHTVALIKRILDEHRIKYDTLQPMVQPDALCNIAETLLGPSLEVFGPYL